MYIWRERYRCRLHACASQGTFSNLTQSHGIANLLMNLGVLFLLRCRRAARTLSGCIYAFAHPRLISKIAMSRASLAFWEAIDIYILLMS